MGKKKTNFNWFFLLAGIFLLYSGFSGNQPSEQPELKTITVSLANDVINVKGRKSKIDYKFWTKEFKNQFNILKGSISRGKHEVISNLKSGQVIDLFISKNGYEKLNIANEDITVRGIRLNGNNLISPEEFYTNRKLYKMRLNVFTFFIGFMFLLNGLIIVSRKANFLLIVVFMATLILMRAFSVVLY